MLTFIFNILKHKKLHDLFWFKDGNLIFTLFYLEMMEQKNTVDFIWIIIKIKDFRFGKLFDFLREPLLLFDWKRKISQNKLATTISVEQYSRVDWEQLVCEKSTKQKPYIRCY